MADASGAARLIEHLEKSLGPMLLPSVRAALLAVDRARYVRPCDRAYAWEDWPLPLDTPYAAAAPPVEELLAEHGTWPAVLRSAFAGTVHATISAPIIYPLAFRLLGLDAGHRLLELGSGSGYGAALAAHVVGDGGRVTSVDVDPHLVSLSAANDAALGNVTFAHDDGLRRADLVATHDRAWLTFSVREVPRALADALGEGAVLLAPVGAPPPAMQRWVKLERKGGAVVESDLPFPVAFIAARPKIDGRRQ